MTGFISRAMHKAGGRPAEMPTVPVEPSTAPGFATRVTQTSTFESSGSGLHPFPGRLYGSGYTDDEIEAMAVEDARASVHDPALWGKKNSRHVRGVDVINSAHDVNVGLIAVELRNEALGVYRELEPCVAQAAAAEQRAFDAIDRDIDVQGRHPTWPTDVNGDVKSTCAEHAELVSRCNALVSHLEALIAQAGHHVRISADDATRQAHLYARRVQISQPEPVSQRLLPDELPKPKTIEDEDLLGYVLGLTGLPPIKRLTTDAVTQRRNAAGRVPLEPGRGGIEAVAAPDAVDEPASGPAAATGGVS